MKKYLKSALVVAACVLASNAIAESRVDAVWNCKLKDGKKMEDVHAANSQWVSHMNGATDVGDITSATATPIVGKQGHFYFVDTYPSLAAWSAVQEYADSDEGEAAMAEIQSQFDDIFECSGNELFKYSPY